MNFFRKKHIIKTGKKILSLNTEIGFLGEVDSEHQQCCMIISELSKALIADKKSGFADLPYFIDTIKERGKFCTEAYSDYMGDTVEDSIAEAWIRIVNWHFYLLDNYPVKVPKIKHVNSIYIGDYFEENIANITDEVLKIRTSYKYLNFARRSIELLAEALGIYLEKHVHFKLKYYRKKSK